MESHVKDRFVAAGIIKENITFEKDSFTFKAPFPPGEFLNRFRNYYGPTMNAFEAAEKNGKAEVLQRELEDMFISKNKSGEKHTTSIAATFLKVIIKK